MSQNKEKSVPRVVIVVTAAATARSFVAGYANFLSRSGFLVTVVANAIELNADDRGNVEWIAVPMERAPSPFHDLISWVGLVRTLKKINPDVVMYATPKASLLTSLAAYVLRVPVRIYQLWGLRLETMSGKMRVLLMMMERLTSKVSTAIVANSHSLAGLYAELGLAAGHDVEVIGQGSSHGVDTVKFSPRATFSDVDEATKHWLQSTSGLLIGFVGRLNRDKGVEVLLRAVELCHTQGIPVRVILVGGKDGIDIENEVARVGRAVPLHFTGSQSDPRPYYAIMDILALPSRREGFPNVILESAAMGIPAIVSDGTGVVDSVLDGQTGMIVPVGNAEALASAIEFLVTNPQKIIEMGKAAHTHVHQNFTQNDVWSKHKDYLSDKIRSR